MVNKNQWSIYGVVLFEPKIMKFSDNDIVARTVIMTESIGKKTYLPISAYNKKAHILAALAHKGSTIYAKGIFKTKTTTTSIQAKELIHIELKITDFDVIIREPIKIKDLDFADVVAAYDPDAFMEVEEDVK